MIQPRHELLIAQLRLLIGWGDLAAPGDEVCIFLLAVAQRLHAEAIDAGITIFDQEFFAHIVNPETNATVYETFSEQLSLSYSGNPAALRLAPPPPPGQPVDPEVVE